MSRSFKKHPSCNPSSNKLARSMANRNMRKNNHIILKKIIRENLDEDDIAFKEIREVSDVYDFPTDGLPGAIDPNNHEVRHYTGNAGIPAHKRKRKDYIIETFNEAKHNKHWDAIKCFINK